MVKSNETGKRTKENEPRTKMMWLCLFLIDSSSIAKNIIRTVKVWNFYVS